MLESTHAPYGQKSAQLDWSIGTYPVSCLRALWEHVKKIYIFLSLTPKMSTPHKMGYIIRKKNIKLHIFPTTLKDQILNIKLLQNCSHFQKIRLENSHKNLTIKFQKWWTAVESKIVKTQPKKQHVTSEIAKFKKSIQYLHDCMLHYYMWPFQFLFCDCVFGAHGISECIPYNPPLW